MRTMSITPKLIARGERSAFWSVASPLLAVLITLLIAAALFALLGQPPGKALAAFLVEPLSSVRGLSAVATKASPLILIAVGLSVAYRCNVWNIGAEGQFTAGAIAGGGLALALPGAPGPLLFPAVLVTGMLGGMLWAGLTAWLRVSFNANEILTSLMLTYIAQFILVALVTGPWRDPTGFGFPQTALFADQALSPTFFGGKLYLGSILAPLIAVLVWLVLGNSVLGFKLRVLGQAPRAARFAGFNASQLVWVALLVSGALAGLAGILEVTGPIGQLTVTLSPGYGFSAIIVCLLGRLNPLGALWAGVLLAVTFVGGNAAQISLRLPNAATAVFQGILLFSLIACDFLIVHRVDWRTLRATPTRSPSAAPTQSSEAAR
jgi:general nucleoside transport system permease protein